MIEWMVINENTSVCCLHVGTPQGQYDLMGECGNSALLCAESLLPPAVSTRWANVRMDGVCARIRVESISSLACEYLTKPHLISMLITNWANIRDPMSNHDSENIHSIIKLLPQLQLQPNHDQSITWRCLYQVGTWQLKPTLTSSQNGNPSVYRRWTKLKHGMLLIMALMTWQPPVAALGNAALWTFRLTRPLLHSLLGLCSLLGVLQGKWGPETQKSRRAKYVITYLVLYYWLPKLMTHITHVLHGHLQTVQRYNQVGKGEIPCHCELFGKVTYWMLYAMPHSYWCSLSLECYRACKRVFAWKPWSSWFWVISSAFLLLNSAQTLS